VIKYLSSLFITDYLIVVAVLDRILHHCKKMDIKGKIKGLKKEIGIKIGVPYS